MADPAPQPRMLDQVDLHAAMRRRCEAEGGQAAFAALCGVSVPFINAVLAARKPASDKVLAVMELRRIVRYVPARART